MNKTRTPFTFTSAGGGSVAAWKNEVKQPKAVLQITHGMSEHKNRYIHFADFCSENGINVYIHDHLGHGETAESSEKIGTLPAAHGWRKMKDDIHTMSEIIREENKGVPHFLLGHSMGSLLVRSLLMSGYCDYRGIILVGSPVNPGLLGPLGVILARMVVFFRGKDYAGKMLHNMVYGSHNKKFLPAKTDFDWLSSDLSVGEEFSVDPLCGKTFSAGFYHQLAFGIKGLFSPLKNSFVPVELPMFIISGSDDPVGAGKKGTHQAYTTYKRAGLENLELKIYQDSRHEILNETNNQEVYADILDWINRRLKTS